MSRTPLLALLLALALALAGCGAGGALQASIADEPPAEATQEAPSPAKTATAAPAPAPASAAPATPASAKPAAPASAAASPKPATGSPAAHPPAKPAPVTVVPILMYHYIRELPPNTPDKLGYGLSVAPKLFDAQLGYLAAHGYHSVSMDDLVSHITHDTPLPPKAVVLSFDDGYADFYSAALPLLRKYHLSATSYIVVDFLGRPGYMSWPQVQDIRDDGVEIGAHTLDHVDLAVQPQAQARRQIDDSRHILQQRLNVPVSTFAYPSGRYTSATVAEVANAGFTSAVTTSYGERHTPGNLLTLARVRVPGGISLPNFVRNLGV